MARSELETMIVRKYRDMAKRFGPKKNSAGYVTKLGRQLPFTFEDFKEWMIDGSFLRKGEGWQCVYCKGWFSIKEIEPEHVVPIARGGDLGTNNLVFSCHSDNQRKGELTAEEYIALIEFMTHRFSPAAQLYLLKTLSGGGQAQRLRFTKKAPRLPGGTS
jgi:HNH endonuclease